MKVLVIGGGISDEREISLRSSNSVFAAVSENHEKHFYDWDGHVDWLVNNGREFDVALPILHGVGGEDGQIQSILEKAGLPYLGSGVASSQICIDKEKTQSTLAAHGIDVPKQAVVEKNEYASHPIAKSAHVLKPVSGGSSIDTFVLKDGLLDNAKQDEVFSKHHKLILEECIIGPELTVPVLDGYDLPAIEIIPGNDFFDYETKYDGSSQEICNPDNISQEVQRHAREVARACHEALGCRHLSRVDIMLGQNNKPYVIEINTMPGLTDQSLFPKAAAYAGLSMTDLVEHFIQLAASSTVSAESV